MKNNRFLLVIKIKKLISSLDEVLINFPKKNIVIKRNMLNEAFHLLEYIYYANYYDGTKRKEFQIKALVSVSMIDYYLEYSYKKNYISLKNFNNKSNILTTINKMLYGWIKSNEL